MKLNEILAEKAAGKEPKYKQLDVAKAIKMLNKYCSQARWMLEEDIVPWRGQGKILDGFNVVDTSATERKSQNTTNYYTMIFDNNPYMRDFPKRSRSFIGSLDRGRAQDYVGSGNLYAMVPFDDTKIGVVGSQDMWDLNITLFGRPRPIEDWNSYYKAAGLKPTLESFTDFAEKLKSSYPDAKAHDEAIQRLVVDFGISWKNRNKYAESFLEDIWEAYSPKKTKMQWYTPETLPRKNTRTEVWVSGKVVMFNKTIWEMMRDAL